MCGCRQFEMLSHRSADIGIARTNADGARLHPRPETQDRHAFTGMVGAPPCGIAAVIGGQQNEIACFELLGDRRQPVIEGLQRCRIARDIAAMTVKHVEIDEVGEDQIAVPGLVHRPQRRLEKSVIAACLVAPGHALMSKDIVDLADSDDLPPGFLRNVEKRRSGRRDGIVLAVTGACKALLRRADEGARDHPADIEWVDHIPDLFAQAVKTREPEMLLVGGDLNHRIARRVEDRLAGRDMLFAELLDDFGARGVAVTEDAGNVTGLHELLHQLLVERGSVIGEITPFEGNGLTGDLPMPRRRVLAERGLAGGPP